MVALSIIAIRNKHNTKKKLSSSSIISITNKQQPQKQTLLK